MTKQNSLYNYSYNFNQIGEYIVTGDCDVNGQDTTWNYTLLIQDNNFTVVIIVTLIAIILVGFGLLKKDVNVVALGNVVMYFLGIWILVHGIDIFFNDVTRALGIVILGLSFYISYKVYEGYTEGF